jgi:hypothetical protein
LVEDLAKEGEYSHSGQCQFFSLLVIVNETERISRPLVKKAWVKFSDSGAYLIGTFIIVYGTVVGAEAADKAQDHSYRY